MTSPSINQQEVEKFSAIADEWWNPNGKFKPLHKFNPVRLAYIKDVISRQLSVVSNHDLENKSQTNNYQPLSGVEILDIGCGGGLLSVPLTRLGAKVTGIDASEKNINVAKAYAEREGLDIEYICTSAEELEKTNHKFDIVLNMEVIEHVADVESFMKASCGLVKEDGLMFVATLNRNLKSFAFAKIGAEYILNWLPKGTHDWNKFFKPHEITNLLEKNTLRVVELKGVSYSPFTAKFSLTDDLSVNFMVVGRK